MLFVISLIIFSFVKAIINFMQTTPFILMIRPVKFGFNIQTAETNTFQNSDFREDTTSQKKALKEFDKMVNILQESGVEVTVIDDTPDPHTPDSIFPNNWVSFHDDGSVFLYPMQAPNRRLERRTDILQNLQAQHFQISKTVDLSYYEATEKFLEGTGSMVLDRENKIAYACISPRTNVTVLNDFAEQAGYQAITFQAIASGKAIYHTNVVMSLGEKYCTICLDAIPDDNERLIIVNILSKTDKEIIEISEEQMNSFAGNMLQIRNKHNELLLVMSAQAYKSLTKKQIETLKKHGTLVHPSLETIETNGGGSARCMIAEIHLPRNV
jgi:hypothetical protein